MTEDLKEKKILVTGASGSLGSQILFELNKHNVKPIAHIRESSDTAYIDSLGLEKRVADLRRRDQMASLVEGIDYIIHTAAFVNFRADRLTQFTGLNTIGALDLFTAAKTSGVKRFIHVSTVGAVGGINRKENLKNLEDMLANEETKFNLDHLRIPYIMTKHAAEVELKKAHDKSSKTELIMVNPSIIVAPSRTEDDRVRALRLFGRLIFPEIPIRINMVDIRDVSRGIISALIKGENGHRYILGGDNITVRELALTSSAVLGKIPHMVRFPRGLYDFTSTVSYMWSKIFGRANVRYYPDVVKLLDYDWAYSSKKAHDRFGYNWRSLHTTLEDIMTNNMVGTFMKPEP